MDRSLFNDRKLIALGLGALVLGAGTVFALDAEIGGLVPGGRGGVSVEDGGCSAGGLSGRTLDAQRRETRTTTSGDRAERVVTYTLEGHAFDGGRLSACTGVGDIEVRGTGGSTALVTFTIEAKGPDARRVAEAAEVKALFKERDGGLQLRAEDLSEHHHDENEWSVSIDIEVPDRGEFDVLAASGVGDIDVAGLDVDTVQLHSGVGDISALDLHTHDGIELSTGVGDIDLDMHPVKSGEVQLRTGTGDIDTTLFSSSEIGYEVWARTGVGSADVDIGRTEKSQHDDGGHGPSEEAYARTAGYGGKPIRVALHADTGVGDIDVET